MERFCLAILTEGSTVAFWGDAAGFTAVRSMDRPHPDWLKEKTKEKMMKDNRRTELHLYIAASPCHLHMQIGKGWGKHQFSHVLPWSDFSVTAHATCLFHIEQRKKIPVIAQDIVIIVITLH
jgi:hypothetical protein